MQMTPPYLIISLFVALILFGILYKVAEYLGKDPRNIMPFNLAKRIRWPLLLLIVGLYLHTLELEVFSNPKLGAWISNLATLAIIVAVTWMVIVLIKVVKQQLLAKYDISKTDNLMARKMQTQYVILENTIVFVIVVIAIGIALMSFNSIRNVGISVLTSAGIAGIIIGFAAQKALGTVLAGIQIALAQPIRFDDVVIIDGEWGRIEEITLTYVVVKIWDKRRLIVPTTFFIDSNFQNWTRTQSDILGTVFLYMDYSVPLEPLREELTRLLQQSEYWDGKVNAVQMTDTTDKTVEIRALMSAQDSSDAFELRVHVREHLIAFLQNNYPDALPKFRVTMPHTNSNDKKEE